MAHHHDRLARRQAANNELQARLAARNAAFDALDAVDTALEAVVAAAATGKGDPLTRAERVRTAAAKVETAVDRLRARAEDLRMAERAKVGEIAELLGLQNGKLHAPSQRQVRHPTVPSADPRQELGASTQPTQPQTSATAEMGSAAHDGPLT